MGSGKPSKLMTSFLAAPSFNSRLFDSSSCRAIDRPRSMFRRRFINPGRLELLKIHVSNPGNHPVMDMEKTSDRERFPKVPKLANRANG